MFRIIKFNLLLKYITYLSILLSVITYIIIQNYIFPSFSILTVVTMSCIISSIIIFILRSPFCSRIIWKIIGVFDKSLFPDLNGSWEGEIILETGTSIEIRCVIRQTLLKTEIDMHGETMKSITLETTPTIVQGQKKLYYVYRCTPKEPLWPEYNGSTLFDIRAIAEGKSKKISLSGKYYTDRKTLGRISLIQASNDPNVDVSYY